MNQDIIYLSEMALAFLTLDEAGIALYKQHGFTDDDIKQAAIQVVLTIGKFAETGEKQFYFSKTTERMLDIGDELNELTIQ